MEAKIILSREKKYWCYRPGDRVEGKLLINTVEKVHCSGIRVDLEAVVKTAFPNKEDGSSRAQQTKKEQLITPKIFTYVWPINWSWAQITGKLHDEHQVCLPASKHIFPFSFHYPQVSLPGSYSTEYGSVKHQVVAYLKTPNDFHRIAVYPLKFGDYFNLAFDPVAMSPLKFEKRKKSLMYSLVHSASSSPLEFTLKLPRRGFLPGEYSPFNLTVINLTGKALTRILVSFIQKISYHGEKGKKILGNVLDLTETVEADSAVETIWESGFYVPQGIKPTFKCAIEHQYFIKVQVFMKGNSSSPSLKGHVPIIIGTVREPPLGYSCSDQEWSPRQRATSAGNHSRTHLYSGRGRRTSMESPRCPLDRLREDSPSTSNAEGSPPPSYSQLSSRAASLDNFLPLYEDAMHCSRRREAEKAYFTAAAGSSGTAGISTTLHF